MVITRGKKTYSITKAGDVHMCFYSILPNGSSKATRRETVALDCVFCQKISTFVILDVLF